MKWTRKLVATLEKRISLRARSHSSLQGHLAQVLKKLKINCVIDVGANEGQHGRLLRGLGYQGRIVSFEPISAVHDVLASACANDEHWSSHQLALGSSDTTQLINVANRSVLSSFLPASEFARMQHARWTDVVHTEEVKVCRLDALFDRVVRGLPTPRVFLKMDTQGYDLKVFAGAEGCLSDILGLQTELSALPLYTGMPDYLDALPCFRKHGFEATGFYPVFREKKSMVLGEIDCVMVRRQRVISDRASTERPKKPGSG